LAVDYRANKCSTIGAAYVSGGMIDKPSSAIQHGAAEKWFVLGLANGSIVQYGCNRAGPFVWTRRGQQYTSELWPGISDFGDPSNEKHVSQYILLLGSQSPNAQVSVAYWGVRNAAEAMEQLPDSPEIFASPATRNTSFLHYLLHLVQERISATGIGNVRLSKRIWNVGRVGSASFIRR
jgi:hypothetical protein